MSEEKSCKTCGWSNREICTRGVTCDGPDSLVYWKPKEPQTASEETIIFKVDGSIAGIVDPSEPIKVHRPTMSYAKTEGMKHDQNKPDWSLLPWNATEEVVKVLTYGAEKYDRENWRKVEVYRYKAAAMRHIKSYFSGEEELDSETGLSHLAHAVCCLMFIQELNSD